jgi:serine/threonine-protein kinase 24/25/MST4
VWALGISAIEMAEVTPPRWKVHPLRVIFMISREPSPVLAQPNAWSETFKDFVSQCLQKVRLCYIGVGASVSVMQCLKTED